MSEGALFIPLPRLMRHDKDNLVGHINPGVVIVFQLGRGDAVPRKDHFPLYYIILGEAKRGKKFFGEGFRSLLVSPPSHHTHLGLWPYLHPGDHLEDLTVSLCSSGFQPRLLKLAGNVVRRPLNPWGADSATGHSRRCQEPDLFKQSLLRNRLFGWQGRSH